MIEQREQHLLGISLNKDEIGVIRTLLYFDIFNYPLNENEILEFHPHAQRENLIIDAIQSLAEKEFIFKLNDFYSLHSSFSLAERRQVGNQIANKRLKTAKRFGSIISKFPFVRAVMLSGSISKNFMDEDSDIDYFIVTTPGKLWLTRGLLAVFKRLFLFNSHKFFCTNYFIDSDSLEIEEKNIYTAIEISTLIPVHGRNLYRQFVERNRWIKHHLPNNGHYKDSNVRDEESSIQKITEKIFTGASGDKLNRFFYRVAKKRWEKKYKDLYSPEDFSIAFKSEPNVSKNHPRFYQKKTLDNFKKRITQFEMSYNLKLSI
jgi:hypothetical protein